MPTYRNEVVEINQKLTKKDKPYIEIITSGRDNKRHKTVTFDPKLIKEFTGPGLYEMTSETFAGDQYPTLTGAQLLTSEVARGQVGAPNGPKSPELEASHTAQRDRDIRGAVILKATAEYCSAIKSLDQAAVVFATFAALLEEYVSK